MAQVASTTSQTVIQAPDTNYRPYLAYMRDVLRTVGSAVYCVYPAYSTAFGGTHIWRAYKSTDGGATWTEQDTGGRPTFAGGSIVQPFHDVVLVGTKFYACYATATGGSTASLYMASFDTATDTWTVHGNTASETLDISSSLMAVVLRGTDLLVLFNAEDGSGKLPVMLKFSTSSDTWGSRTAFEASGGTRWFMCFSTPTARSNGDILVTLGDTSLFTTKLFAGVLDNSDVLTNGAVIEPYFNRARAFERYAVSRANGTSSAYDALVMCEGLSADHSSLADGDTASVQGTPFAYWTDDAQSGTFDARPLTHFPGGSSFYRVLENGSVVFVMYIASGALYAIPYDETNGVFGDTFLWRDVGTSNGLANNTGYDTFAPGDVDGSTAIAAGYVGTAVGVCWEAMPFAPGACQWV